MNNEMLFGLLRAARDRTTPIMENGDDQEVLRHAHFLISKGYIGKPGYSVVKLANGNYRLIQRSNAGETWLPAINQSGLDKLTVSEQPF